MIRNFPGFNRGISGAKLAFRAFQQAWIFGAVFHFMRSAVGIEESGDQPDRPLLRRHRGHRHVR